MVTGNRASDEKRFATYVRVLFGVPVAIVIAWAMSGATTRAMQSIHPPDVTPVTQEHPVTLPSWKCGEATAHFQFIVARHETTIPPGKKKPLPDLILAVLTVAVNGQTTEIRIDDDFLGAVCAKDSRDRPMIVLHSYCGGNICSDTDGWGIVDPETLTLLMFNGDKSLAERYLARPVPTVTPMYSIWFDGFIVSR